MEPTEHFGVYFGYIQRLFQRRVSPFKYAANVCFQQGATSSRGRSQCVELAILETAPTCDTLLRHPSSSTLRSTTGKVQGWVTPSAATPVIPDSEVSSRSESSGVSYLPPLRHPSSWTLRFVTGWRVQGELPPSAATPVIPDPDVCRQLEVCHRKRRVTHILAERW